MIIQSDPFAHAHVGSIYSQVWRRQFGQTLGRTQLADDSVKVSTIADTMARDSCVQKEAHAMRLQQ